MINRIIDFSARNRFIVLTLVAVATIFGWWSMNNVALDAIPDLSDTQVIVYSRWDRSPDIIEDQVTYPIVTAMLGAPKVKAVRGFSDFGYSFVYVIFEDGTDIYWARTRTLEYLSGVLQSLPQGAKTELGPDATGLGWVFQYVLEDSSGKHSLADLRSLQDWYLRYHLKSVPGVAEVAPIGGFGKQYQVNVDPNRLQAYNIPINRVVEAIRGSNNETGGRMIELGGAEYMVRGRGYAKSLADIENVVVAASENGSPIRVKDIGQVALGPDLRRGVADLDGTGEAVSGIVVMRQGENALDVIGRVKEKIRQIEPGLPEGVKIVPIYDRSRAHPPLDRHAEVHRHRSDRHGVADRAAVPVAHSERAHPDDHHSGRRADLVHSVPRDGHHGQHHVAGRHRHRHRRDGGRVHRGGGAGAQETGGVGGRRAARRLQGGGDRGGEGGRRPELLRAAGDRRLLPPGAGAGGAGRAAVQAAGLHQEPGHDRGGGAGHHARPGAAAVLSRTCATSTSGRAGCPGRPTRCWSGASTPRTATRSAGS